MSPYSRAIGVAGKASTGAIIGSLVGAGLGFCLGALATSLTDVRMTRQELADIHYLGFPQYTTGGIAFLTTVICGVAGALGGFVGAGVAASLRRVRGGILSGTVAVLVVLFASGVMTSHSLHWHETKIVEVIGSIAGAAVATSLARALQRQEELDPTAQPLLNTNWTSQQSHLDHSASQPEDRTAA